MFKFIKYLIVCSIFIALIAGGGFIWLISSPIALKADTLEFRITQGSGLRAAANVINNAGAELHPWLFIVLCKVMRVESSLKAGSYEINRGITPLVLMDKLVSGDVIQVDIGFIEGWTLRQVRERLNAHPDIKHESKNLSVAELMRAIGASGASESTGEGWFFPDTYQVDKQSSDIEVLVRAYKAMQHHLAKEWAGREANLPYKTPYQALIMASIIEKETGRDADRALVAAVFVNRLRIGMLLQTDPTVIYGMNERFDGNIRKRDLQTDTPYNTYTRAGLPPTPIAMPGLASLRAALHPANSAALYFVARGDGSSQFSATLDEHNQAVNRYQRGRNP